jgi:ADP-ribosylglycohydrolase
MLGAVIGDMVGSVYEWNNRKAKDFSPFFHARSHPTDDSVLTIAVADSLLNNRPPVHAFKDWGRRYPKSGWGGRFSRWLFSDETAPYGSFGNGAAMRVSPTALLGKTLDETLATAQRVTAITHDHPEGLKGAAAIRQGRGGFHGARVRCPRLPAPQVCSRQGAVPARPGGQRPILEELTGKLAP